MEGLKWVMHGQAPHLTGRALAKTTDISLRPVRRIRRAYQLQPHRMRPFKFLRDPSFASKRANVVGLKADPPVHAVVLSLDEKS